MQIWQLVRDIVIVIDINNKHARKVGIDKARNTT
jgi:hypothetical protein